MTFDRRRVWEHETFALARLHTQDVLSSSAGTLRLNIQRLIGHQSVTSRLKTSQYRDFSQFFESIGLGLENFGLEKSLGIGLENI